MSNRFSKTFAGSGSSGINLLFTSDYFETLYELAIRLIHQGDAYVCSLTPEQTREYRGGWNTVGRDSPDRDRPIPENLDLFRRMRAGEFPDGQYTLRAKIDMASPNMNLRDPAMYRIRHAHHHRSGDAWCIYPTYDWAHGQSDSLEQITHSLCTLEFENHRPLYEWFIEKLGIFPSRTDRVCQTGANQHDDEQAAAAGTGQGRLCGRLG